MTARTARVVVLGGAALAVLAVGAWTLSLNTALSDQPCNDAQTFPGVVVVIVSVAAFALGHVAGHLRDDGSADDPDALLDTPAPGRLTRHARLVLRSAVVVFLVLGMLVLVYETIGLTNAFGTRPITSYVRCGASRSPVRATLAAAGISTLAGHWLWYPRPRREVR